jgi:hypothetical protein
MRRANRRNAGLLGPENKREALTLFIERIEL